MAFHDFPNLLLRFGDITFPYRRRTSGATREAHRSRPRRPDFAMETEAAVNFAKATSGRLSSSSREFVRS
jgi:hypothetical protein